MRHVSHLRRNNQHDKRYGLFLMARFYFAYGSNMVQEQMRWRCPGALMVGRARLIGQRFLINQCGIATILPAASEQVYGILWRITPNHERLLDEYEGVDEGWYRKVCMDLALLPAGRQQAMLYIACGQQAGIPQRGYLEEIIGAAVTFHFPSRYIQELRTWLH